MRSIYIIFGVLIFFTNTLMAEPRSLMQRLNGDSTLTASHTILFKETTKKRSEDFRASVNLTTPYLNYPDNKLRTDEKRSIMLLNHENIEELEYELKKEIYKVSQNKGPLKFKNTGLSSFHIFANFVHSRPGSNEPDFYIAMIPKNIDVKKVIFQIEWFGSGAGAHTQIRMIFDQPIMAIPQRSTDYSAQIVSNISDTESTNSIGVADIIFSPETVQVESGQLNEAPFKGIMGEYGTALQFFSTPVKAKKQIGVSVVKEYEILNLEQSQKNAVFNAAISTSNKEEETTIYHTIFNSCVTHTLRALQGTYNSKNKTYQGLSGIDTHLFNPYSVLEKISKSYRGGTRYRGTLNDEFSYLVNNKVMTEDARKATESYKKIAPLTENILKNEAFDRIMRQLAFFILDEGITYDQIQGLTPLASQKGATIADIPKTDASKAVIAKISNLWTNSEFKNHPIEDFFRALTGLKTQAP